MGDIDVGYNLGNIYLLGNGLKQNVEKGIEIHIKYAEKGVLKSINQMGNIYVNELLKPRDMDQALYYYNMGAELNDLKSQLALGDIYLRGLGVKVNNILGLKWYLIADKFNKQEHKELKIEKSDTEHNILVVKEKMTTSEISESNILAEQFLTRH